MKYLILLCVVFAAWKTHAQVTDTPDEKIAALTIAIEKTPSDDDLFYQRAYLYFTQKKLDLAQADVSKAVNLNRQNHKAYFLYAYISMEKGEISSAYFYANEAIKNNPEKDAKAYLLRAFGNEGRDKLENAVSDYKTVLELEPTNTQALERLPIVLAKIKKEESYKKTLNKESEKAALVNKIITFKETEYNTTLKNCEDLTADFLNRRKVDKSLTMNSESVKDIKKAYKNEYLNLIKISDERIAMCPKDLETSSGNLATLLSSKRNSFISDWLKLTSEDIFK